jgi:hypothetical protein
VLVFIPVLNYVVAVLGGFMLTIGVARTDGGGGISAGGAALVKALGTT